MSAPDDRNYENSISRTPLTEGEETRSLTDVYLASGAAGAGLATGKLAVDVAAEKIKAVLKEDRGPKIWTPPDAKK